MAQKIIKLQLLTRIAGVGREGEIVEVNHSYGMNALVGKGLARVATAEVQKVIEEKASHYERTHVIFENQSQEALQKIHNTTIEIHVRGSDKKIFGSIKSADIADHIKKLTGVQFESRHIHLPTDHPLKEI
jgi:large subunit ribosomal protein L9